MKVTAELKEELYNLRYAAECARMAHDFERYHDLKDEIKKCNARIRKSMVEEIERKERGGMKR